MKHEKYSIGYDLLRIYARFLHMLIHRRITISGLDNIPKNTPLIFAPNHQNALMDALAVLLSSPHQPTWLARADIFKNKTVSKILNFLKMSPVYRIRDGKDNLGKNDEVFELSIRVLKNNKSLAIFPEAKHTFKRQSATHKKAVPRIAFMAEERENFNLGIHIIPIGIFYNHYNKFNRELIVTFGEAIKLKDYEELYIQNPGVATIALRDAIYEGLVRLTIHIKSKNHYEDYETLREIYRNGSLEKLAPAAKFEKEQQFIKSIETWEEANPEKAVELFSKCSAYSKSLHEINLSDRALAGKNSFIKTIINAFLAGLSLPIFLYGWLNFLLGFYLPSVFIRKKINDKVFWATVEYVAWIIFIPVFTLIQWGVVWAVSGDIIISLVYLFSLPIFGKLALNINDFYIRVIQQIRILNSGKAVSRLMELRKSIADTIGNIPG
ncbi:MAG: 1-acyl-sn-glycerol-3-phosphate acyltransferase [Bacteroidales bacterium]|nr:1-acyl-sn-glycerol-3-phosphate acyltransferase [Bacteroidales bacterium]